MGCRFNPLWRNISSSRTFENRVRLMQGPVLVRCEFVMFTDMSGLYLSNCCLSWHFVTRQICMGISRGSINFQYNTHDLNDRILVFFEDENTSDSGCVGTLGVMFQTVSFDGKSAEIRVYVEPNCQGMTWTAWYFITGCPSLCVSSSSNKKTRQSSQLVISSNQKAITSSFFRHYCRAAMPALKAECCDSISSVSWEISVEPLPIQTKKGSNMATVCRPKTFGTTGRSVDITNAVGEIRRGIYTITASAPQNRSRSLSSEPIRIPRASSLTSCPEV